MQKKISVIIPCYNVEQYIDRCVSSLVNQTIGIENLELIFVDDASTDETCVHLEKWEQQYEDSVLIVKCEENGRQGRARNIGLLYASTPYISYVDADDWVELNMFQDLYEVAVSTGVQVVAGQMGRDYGDGKFCYIEPYAGITNQVIKINTSSDRRFILEEGLGGGVVGKIYRREFLQEANLFFPEELAYEDNFFEQLLLFAVSSYVVLNRYYYHYFFNSNSTVSSADSRHQFDRLTVAIMTVEELLRRGYGDEYGDEIEVYFLRIYYVNTLHIIFTRFQILPYKQLNQMQTEVWKRYPEYRKDGAFLKLGEREQVMLSTLTQPLTERQWDEIAESYREYCDELEKAYLEENKEKYLRQ